MLINAYFNEHITVLNPFINSLLDVLDIDAKQDNTSDVSDT